MSIDWDKEGYPYVIFSWLLFAIVTPLVPVRLYVQLQKRTRPWREVFIVLAWVGFLVFCITGSLLNHFGWYNNNIPYDEPEYATMANNAYNSYFVYTFVYLQILYACKAALLMLYNDLVTRHTFPMLRWAIIATGVCVAGASINELATSIGMVVWWNGPPPTWDTWVNSTYYLHLATDIQVFIIPFFILRCLGNLTRGQKWGAYAIFALGFVNILNAVILLLTYGVMGHSPTPVKAMLFKLQPATAIMIACLPYCRRFWIDISSKRKKIVAVDPETYQVPSSPSTPPDPQAIKGRPPVTARDMGTQAGDIEKGSSHKKPSFEVV